MGDLRGDHGRTRRRIRLAVLGLLSTVLLVALSGESQASPALSGAYTGPANVAGLRQFGDWSGAPTNIALDFLSNSAWSDIAQPAWTLDAWRSFQVHGGTFVLSVPMLVDSPSGSFAAGARGAYDQYYEKLGQRLVADGFGNATLRMGWEFNGTWFPWSLSASSSMGPRAFVADWRHLVELLRAIPGADFRFDWNVNPGPSAVRAAAAYPGNRYVDYVGVDAYDSSWTADGHRIINPTARWNQIANQPYGLNWWAGFARSHHKRLTVPEWGLNLDTGAGSNGAGDDPSFIAHMYHWMTANRPAFQVYFDYNASALDTAADPRATATYRRLFQAKR